LSPSGPGRIILSVKTMKKEAVGKEDEIKKKSGDSTKKNE
jgi:hypothetical protein